MANPIITNLDGTNPGPAGISTPNTQSPLMPQNQPNPGSGIPAFANGYRLLAVARSVNANQTGDTVIPIINSQSWAPAVGVWTNASISLTTATSSLYTGPGATGTAIIASASAMSGCTGPTVVIFPTIVTATKALAYGLQNGFTNYLYYHINTAQGAAATFDFFLYGYDLS